MRMHAACSHIHAARPLGLLIWIGISLTKGLISCNCQIIEKQRIRTKLTDYWWLCFPKMCLPHRAGQRTFKNRFGVRVFMFERKVFFLKGGFLKGVIAIFDLTQLSPGTVFSYCNMFSTSKVGVNACPSHMHMHGPCPQTGAHAFVGKHIPSSSVSPLPAYPSTKLKAKFVFLRPRLPKPYFLAPGTFKAGRERVEMYLDYVLHRIACEIGKTIGQAIRFRHWGIS